MATSGMVAVLMMAKLCNRVSVYGFGSVPKDARLPLSGASSLSHSTVIYLVRIQTKGDSGGR
jgi:hypothetical protein